MKKLLYGFLALMMISGCAKEKIIKVNQINTGYSIKEISTFDDIPQNTFFGTMISDESLAILTKYDINENILGYASFDMNDYTVKHYSKDETPIEEDEKYGSFYLSTTQYNVYQKLVSDYDKQMNKFTYYVENDGVYTLLCEVESPMLLTYDISHVYVYEENDIAYLVYKDTNELVVNEIEADGYKEIKRYPLKDNNYELTNYYYEDAFIMTYTSDEGNLLRINDEEYEFELYSHFVIFNDIVLFSKYSELDGGDNQELIGESYVIDRHSKKHYDLDTDIDTRYWWKCNGDFYYSYDTAGYLMFMSYNDSIEVIQTSLNRNAEDNQELYFFDESIFVFTQDFFDETCTVSLLSLEKK